jgi:hypothetical protein
MQVNATAHSANNSVDAIGEVFDGRVISRGLWFPLSTNLNPCDFWGGGGGVLHAERKIICEQSAFFEEHQESIRHEISAGPT